MAEGLDFYKESDSKIQWSTRFVNMRLINKVSQATSSGGPGNQGTQSTAIVSFTANNPMLAIRTSSGAGWAIANVTNSSGTNWQATVYVSGAAGTTVTAYVFDNTAPPSSNGGLETFDTAGNRLFSLASKPARIVGSVPTTGIGSAFTGSTSKLYAGLMPVYYSRTATTDLGSPPATRYEVSNYMNRCIINDGTAQVYMNRWLYQQVRQSTSLGTYQYGIEKLLVLDVTNY